MGILSVNIALLRKRTGLTVKQLAERIEVGSTTIINIETGYITAPSERIISALAKVFDTTIDGLLGRTHLDIAERARMVYVVDSLDPKNPFVEYEKIIGSVFIDRDKLRGYEYFGLKIKDNSMVNRRILSGDVVIVRRDSPVRNDDIVVVAAKGREEILIRTFIKNKNKIVLKAENDSDLYEDLVFDIGQDMFKLIGKVIKCEFEL